jgi:hypothetical protein
MEVLKTTFVAVISFSFFFFIFKPMFSLCALVEKYFAMDFLSLSPLYILNVYTVRLLLFFQLVITFDTFISRHFHSFSFFHSLLNVIFSIQDPAAVSSSFQKAEKFLCTDKSFSS